MFWTIGLVSVAIVLIYKWLVWNYDYWHRKGVVSVEAVPIFGSFWRSAMLRVNRNDEIDEVYKKYRDVSPFVGFFTARNPSLILLNPKMIKEVLIGNFKSFHDNEFSELGNKEKDPIFSNNPFMLRGEEWKEKRSEITPAFTTTKLRNLYPILTDVCGKMSSYMKEELKKNPKGFDAKELSSKYTADVVSNCIYGIDSKSFTEEKSLIREMGTAVFEENFGFLILMTVGQLFPSVIKHFPFALVDKKIERFFTKLMEDAIALRQTSQINRDDFLSYLLELQKKKNLQTVDMAAHTLTFFLDGFETSSGVLAHTLFRLADNRDVQTRLREEIREVMTKDGSINYENLSQMEYLDQVFNESLRIAPFTSFISKLCTAQTTLTDYKDKKVDIEVGTVVYIPIYSLHNDPEYYSNPNVFDPDRFSAANGGLKAYRDKGVFLGFGDGPRMCLGMRFALMQMKAATVELIGNFEVTVNEKTQTPFKFDPANFFLMPIGGIWVDFKPI